MARRPRKKVEVQQPVQEAPGVTGGIEDFIGERRPRKARSTPFSATRIEELVEEVGQRAKSGDWEGARPTDLAALYVWCHRRVYKVDPALRGKEFKLAVFAAARLVAGELGGDVGKAVEFVRWTWSREMRRLKTPRPGDDFRVSWRYQFSVKLLVGYRVDTVRSRATAVASG